MVQTDSAGGRHIWSWWQL